MSTIDASARPLRRHFASIAEASKASEEGYRRQVMTELARMEAARVEAFRRVRLVSLLEDAARESTSDDAVHRQQTRLCEEFGWNAARPAEKTVLERIVPVCRAIAAAVSGEQKNNAVESELKAFEAWFREDRGVSVYTLFDRYVQETPVVDF